MSLPKTGPAKTILLTLAVLFSLILVSFVYISKFVVPNQIRGYIEEISKDRQYKIEIKDIEYDFFSGLEGKEIKISDPLSLAKPILQLGKIAIQPELLSSLIDWKVKVKGIIIDKPTFSFTGDELQSLMKLIGGDEKKEKSLPIEIERVEIRDAEVEIIPGLYVNSKKIELNLANSEPKEERVLKLNGSATIKNNELHFHGVIKPFLDAPSGELNINLPYLNTDSFATDFKLPVDISLSSDLRFQISDNITSLGTINFAPLEKASDKRPAISGKLDYDLSYARQTDTAFIRSASLNIDKLIQVSILGSIERLRKEAIFNLSANTQAIKLENIAELFPRLSHLVLSGDIETNDLKIKGSRSNKDISLSGRAVVKEIGINDKKNDFKISGLKGSLDFEKMFYSQTSNDLSVEGIFSLKSISTNIGELTGVFGNVELVTDSKQGDKIITLSSLKGSFLDGQIAGDIRLGFNDHKKTVQGNLGGGNLNLNKIPENYIFTDFGGNIEEFKTKFNSENMRDFNSRISLTLTNFKLVAGEKEIIKASKAQSIGSFGVKFSLKPDNSNPGEGNFSQKENAGDKENLDSTESKIAVESKGLSYENLSYNEFSTNGGKISELSFKLEKDNNWALNIISAGSRFHIADKDVSLQQFELDINALKNGQVVISGKVDGQNGTYDKVALPALSANFQFSNDLLQLTNLRAQLQDYGELQSKELDILFEEKDRYNINFNEGKFSGFGEKIDSEGIKAEFVFDTSGKNKTSWNGNVFLERTNIASQHLSDLSARIKSSEDGINFESISGKFRGGHLKGNLFMNTTHSPNSIESEIQLQEANLPLDAFQLSLSKLVFKFKGNLQNSSFPQGSGLLSFSDLSMAKNGAASSLKGEMQIETSGETISVKDWFIENEGGDRINISAKMENSLDRGRSLKLDLPTIPMSFLQKTFSPILPQVFKEGVIKGDLGLTLALNRFLQEGVSWDGELSLKDVSFNGKFQDTIFLINDVNGTVPIRNNGKPGISLVSFMRDYGETDKLLNEKVFDSFLRTSKQNGVRSKTEFLTIGEIQYGFLRLENIECDLELNKSKLNLRHLYSKLYEGRAFGTGSLDLSGRKKFNLSLLFKDISLNSISNSIPSAKDYITGRINGLVWVRGKGERLNTLDGAFDFRAIDSKEPKRIAKALLQKLGVKEKLLLRSSRRYDNGVISGYIKAGVITFRELNISNRILGVVQDLSIKVDEKRNSISVAHFLSVIRETAKRASKGDLKIEFKK